MEVRSFRQIRPCAAERCWFATLLLVAALQACTALPERGPRELLDERTGATLITAAEPLVFARSRTDVAANARDYATLVGVEADRSGQYAAYLLVYRWSTVDRRVAPLPEPVMGALIAQADGRELNLKPLNPTPAALQGRRDLHAPPTSQWVAWAYGVDLPTLLYIAESSELALRFPDETVPVPFSLWRDGRKALQDFAARGVRR
jgi:hypothetical protein